MDTRSNDTITCPKCHATHDDTVFFCTECGNKLKVDAPVFAPVEPAAPVFAPVEPAAPVFAPAEPAAPVFAPAEPTPAPAFAPVEAPAQQPKVESAPVAPVVQEEPASIFAQGLPAWDIVPPQIMVRRR